MASALPAGGLALSARGWPASPAGTSRGRPSGQEHLDEPRIKCAAGLALKLLHGRLDPQGHSIGTVGGQRVEDVGDRDDARADGNPVPAEPVGVPAPVPALVMMPNDLGSLREEVEGRDDAGANLRMVAPGLPLVGRQRPRLPDEDLRHANLADVVESARLTDEVSLVHAPPERQRRLARPGADPSGMPTRVPVPCLEGVGQAFEPEKARALETRVEVADLARVKERPLVGRLETPVLGGEIREALYRGGQPSCPGKARSSRVRSGIGRAEVWR